MNQELTMAQPGKNRLCPCGSGKKYKLCCMSQEEKNQDRQRFRTNSASQDWPDPQQIIDELMKFSGDELKNGQPAPENNPLVAEWWANFLPHYKKMDLDRMLPLIRQFMEQHPGEVFNLGLQQECLFELAPAMDKAGRLAEYIALLEKLRTECPQAYLDAFAPFDSGIIEYRVSLGHDQDIVPYLDNFIKFPNKAPDYLAEVIALLAITGREAELKTLLAATAAPLLKSAKVIGGGFAADKLLDFCYDPFLRENNCSQDAVRAVAVNMKKAGQPEREIDKEAIAASLKNFVFYNNPLDFAAFNYKSKDNHKPYAELLWRFIGFLANEIGCELTTAHEFGKYVIKYIYFLVHEEKREMPFTFSAESLDQYIVREFTIFLNIKAVPAIGLLQGLIYFHQFLNKMEAVPRSDINGIISASGKLFELIVKTSVECASCVKRIYQTYPHFQGKVI